MEKSSRLSSRERKNLEAEAGRLKEQKRLQTARRRRLAGTGLVAGSIVLAAGAAIGAIVSHRNDSAPSPTQATELYGEDAWRLIQKEIEKNPEYRSITDRDRIDEADLWYGVSQAYPENIPDDPEGKRNTAIEIVSQTIDAMGASRNPYFNHAYEVISEQIINGNLIFDTFPLEGPDAKTGLAVNNNQLHWVIAYDTDSILADQSGVTLALVITHEAVHLEEGLKFRQENPFMSTDEFADLFDKRYLDDERKIYEESLAYSVGARAFMFNTDLIQYAVSGDFTPMIDAANLIRCQRNELSDCWQGYIASEPERISGY